MTYPSGLLRPLWFTITIRNAAHNRSVGAHKCRMVRVDISRLDVDQALGVFACRPKSLPQELRDSLDQLRVQLREPRQLLASAVVANPDELLVHQLDASQTRRLKELDLRLDQQVERNLGDKHTRARAMRVADRGANVLRRQVAGRVK